MQIPTINICLRDKQSLSELSTVVERNANNTFKKK